MMLALGRGWGIEIGIAPGGAERLASLGSQ